MFAHLTSLNQHKRSHNQDDNPNENITLIQQHQGMPTTMQTIISETGQNLGQIQIVATESLEPATSQSMHANEVTMIQTKQIEKQKCVTCGGHMNHNPKRKGPKLIRCENCIHSENVQNIRREFIFNYNSFFVMNH